MPRAHAVGIQIVSHPHHPRPVLASVHVQRVIFHRLHRFGLSGADGVFHQHIPALVVNVVFLGGVNVFHPALVVHKVRNSADKMPAGVKYLKHRPALAVKCQPVVQLHLACKSRVVARCPEDVIRVLFLHGRNALALTLVEDSRVCHAGNLPPAQHWLKSGWHITNSG